jgi:manganese transport protein
MLGSKLSPILFAVALIAAGQSSTITGTLAGQIIMEGYLRLRINPWMRRLITRMVAIIPAVLVILINGENNINDLLIFSQVVLSLQLGFAIIPLIHFVSDKKTMGVFAIKPVIKTFAWLVASVLVYLNMKMVFEEASSFFQTSDNILSKAVIILASLLFVALLLTSFLYPLIFKKPREVSVEVHKAAKELEEVKIPRFKTIAVALDFGKRDTQLLAHAMTVADLDTEIVVIHVVESASAKVFGNEADDFETRKDQEKLDAYVEFIRSKGHSASSMLGFQNRTKEIPRLIKEAKADLLIIGSHGHKGVKDWLYGETIETVRHQVKIPVLIV